MSSDAPPPVITVADAGKDKKPSSKGGRMPTLDDLARRMVPGASTSTDSIPSVVSEAGSVEPASVSGPGAARPRLPASILSHRSQSQARSISSVAVEAPSSERSTPTVEGAGPILGGTTLGGEEPPKDLAKDKVYRGYKNVPSLEAITERMRARTNSTAAVPVESPSDQSAPSSSITSASSSTVPLPSTEEEPAPMETDETLASGTAVADESHPLAYTWTLYHDSRGRVAATPLDTPVDAQYAANLTVIGEFETVENFCRYLNWLRPPSQIETGSNYHLFKKGIQPMWEDAANANGGKWVITMKSNPDLLDRCWSWLCMALVGEQLDERDEICGAVVSVRHKIDRIQIWTRSKDNVDALNGIGKKIHKLLDLGNEPSVGMEFQYHSEDRPARNKFIHIAPRGMGIGGSGGGSQSAIEPRSTGTWGSGGGGAFGAFGKGGAFASAGGSAR